MKQTPKNDERTNKILTWKYTDEGVWVGYMDACGAFYEAKPTRNWFYASYHNGNKSTFLGPAFDTLTEAKEACEAHAKSLPKSNRALDTQVGGDHYKSLPIQPMEYSMANGLNACQHTAIKYITRAYDKGNFEEEVDKAIHTLQLWKELERRNKHEPESNT